MTEREKVEILLEIASAVLGLVALVVFVASCLFIGAALVP